MALVSFGKKTVTVAGTPVQVTTTVTNLNTLYVQALSSNSGKIYLGLAGIVKASLANVLRVLVPPPTTPLTLDSFSPGSGVSVGPMDLSTIWLDSDNSGEGVLISYLVC